jgi:hypothetical protein
MSTPSAPAPCASASVAPTASQKRAAHPAFAQWSLAALAPHLPLRFPVPADLPPSPKRRYRSGYRPPDPTPLADPTARATQSDFEIALLLIDFSPLEALLAQHDRPSHKGQVPFRPVSLFLAICLRRERVLSWQGVAQLLASTHGAAWRALFGFVAGVTPSASGPRFFFQAVGAPVFDDLCPRFAALQRTADLLPTHSTYPGDPPDQGVTVSQDGMLHAAHDLSHCFFATAACYQPRPERPVIPLTPVATPRAASAMPAPVPAPAPVPTPPASVRARPCSAQEKGHAGCPCVSPTCQDHCERASPTDREARFIHYQGHNAKHGETKGAKGKGRAVFGYRSIVERVLDDRFAIAWTVRSSLYPANTDERTVFRERVHALQQALPDLPIGEWLDDAGVGYGPCLAAIWELGAFRMVDIRADKSDADPEACRHRGYDAFGRPLCPHGYSLRANGYDHQRRRAKYVCTQACRREPLTPDGPIAPVAGCPFLDPVHPLGVIVNVGKTLPDGSTRLAREIPYGSDAWKARYGRRNLSESRNSQVEAVDLKRLPSSGLARGAKEIQLADFLINLRTVGRLVREASTR